MIDNAKILIIDDEEIVLDSCREILSGAHYEIATATDGEHGLELLDELGPDLMFVDLKMPGISGFDVLERARERHPHVVAIVITGYSTVSSAVEAMKRGAYDFLPKPFTPDEFRLITMRGLEKRHLTLETIRLKRERETLRDNFAAIVSHELKSPLAAVQQNLYALQAELGEGAASSASGDRVVRMQERVDDLLELIDTWLRGFAVDTDRLQERFAPVELDAVLDKAADSARHHAQRKGVDVDVSEDGGPARVLGDEGTLVEAFLNVIGNAVKYSYPGGTVSVEARAADGHVMVTVADRGVGIQAEDLPLLFHDFYRGSSNGAGPTGYGMGLAISKRIIEAHGGSIAVESAPGVGSTFTVTLPRLGAAHAHEHLEPTGIVTSSPQEAADERT